MPTYTFGFEAEFQKNVQEIAHVMHDNGHTQDAILHNYTCDCEGCEVSFFDAVAGEYVYDHDSIYNLRIKNDSSCGGELISKVWDSPDDNRIRKLWTDIERAAINVDTEPGLTAGFHVHVGRSHLDLAARGRLILTFAGWERPLLQLASGRWPTNRGWNGTLDSHLSPNFRFLADEINADSPPVFNDCSRVVARLQNEPENSLVAKAAYRQIARDHQGIDRHTSLSFSERHPTMEFRLWNSTRAAWRMELWCRMSLLLSDPEFDKLLLKNWTHNPTLEDLVNTIADYDGNGSKETFTLAERQLTYLKNCDTLDIDQSTPLTIA